jgi:ribosomal protein S18 acetylase RimI-like enzyme
MKLNIRKFKLNDEEEVIDLWRACGLVVPWNNPHLDIQRKLKVQPELFQVGCLDGKVIASVMAGYEGHRGWVNYLAVHPDYQRRGIGRKMMEQIEKLLLAQGCPKINLQVRKTNKEVIIFYQRIGFKDDNVIGMGKRLILDD